MTVSDDQQMFTFVDTDNRAINSELKEYDDAVQQALRASVPGLIGMQSNEGAQSVLQGDLTRKDRSKHRTLVPPNAFNVSILFQPTLAFIKRAGEIVPPGHESETTDFSSTLEDFVVQVFLPQLDEKVTASFQQAVSGRFDHRAAALTSGYDAYQLDRDLSQEIDKPPLKAS